MALRVWMGLFDSFLYESSHANVYTLPSTAVHPLRGNHSPVWEPLIYTMLWVRRTSVDWNFPIEGRIDVVNGLSLSCRFVEQGLL